MQAVPFNPYTDTWVPNDSAHCEPSDWVKTNLWVCPLTL